MDNPKDLSPLAKGDIEIGKSLPFPIFDRHGVLLLAAGQAITTVKQLDELSAKGLYQNPRWAVPPITQLKSAQGSIKPEGELKYNSSKVSLEEPSETGFALKMNLIGQADVFSVKLVGALGKEAFVVSHPMRDGSCIFTKEGQSWEFRSIYGLSVYHFSAMVEKVLLSPYPMLVMAWPQEAQLEARLIRSARRVACEIPATIHLPDDGDMPRNAVINNLSTGGVELKVSVPVDLPIGSSLSVAFQLTILGRKYLMDLTARVVHPGPQIFGLSFDQVSDHEFAALHAFVCDRLIARLGSPLYAGS